MVVDPNPVLMDEILAIEKVDLNRKEEDDSELLQMFYLVY